MKSKTSHVEWGFVIEKKGESIPLFDQVHGKTVLILDKPLEPSQPLLPADGAITTKKEFPLSVFSADCYPVLFFSEDPAGPIAAVHAGWRGIYLGIVGHTLTLLPPSSPIHVIIGPGIGPCCFSVREDFIQQWESAHLDPQHYLAERGGRFYFDLLSFLLKHELKNIPKERIHLDNHRCTACSSPQLPSFRRNKTANPRIRSWIKKLEIAPTP